MPYLTKLFRSNKKTGLAHENSTIAPVDVRETVLSVFNVLTDTLIKSYGPLGGTSIVNNGSEFPSVTKDGLTILKGIHFESPTEQSINRLIRRVSEILVDKVGDGSTSAIISASNLYKHLSAAAEPYRTDDFVESLNVYAEIIEYVIQNVFKRSLPSDMDERIKVLSLIASLSNNNNPVIGKSVAEIMAHLTADSSVKVMNTPRDGAAGVYAKMVSGFTTDRYRPVHGAYFANKNKLGVTLQTPLVIMSYSLMEVHYNYILNKIMTRPEFAKTPIVVIAETIQKEVEDQIVQDAFIAISQGAIAPITLLTTGALNSPATMEDFMDLATYVGADPARFNMIAENADVEPDNVVGIAGAFSINPSGKSSFEQGKGNKLSTPDFVTLTNNLTEALYATANNLKAERGRIRLRLNRLNGVNATVYVSAYTEEEKENLRFLVEDSVLACQSVMRNGYTAGANAAPYYASLLIYTLLSAGNPATHDFIEDDTATLPLLAVLGNGRASEHLQKVAKMLDDAMSDSLKKNGNILYEMSLVFVESFYETFVMASRHHEVNDALIPSIFSPFDFMVSAQNIPKFGMSSGSAVPEVHAAEALIAHIPNLRTMEIDSFSVALTDTVSLPSATDETNVIAPVSTDIEILRAALSIARLFLTSNQFVGY